MKSKFVVSLFAFLVLLRPGWPRPRIIPKWITLPGSSHDWWDGAKTSISTAVALPLLTKCQ